jgi:hypothetical protein
LDGEYPCRYRAVANHPEHGHCVLMLDDEDRQWVMIDQLKNPVRAIRAARELYKHGEVISTAPRPYA